MLLKERMKYKLIKIYPGSPVLGTVVEKGYTGYVPEGHSNSLGSWSLMEGSVENYPEFWQPLSVYDKEWADSLVGNLFAIASHVKQGHGTKNMAERLNEYGSELAEYFKDKLK